MSKEFTFQNISITLSADTGKEAYDKLCNILAEHGAEWTTDTYYEESEPKNVKSTSELFPDV